MYTWLPDWIEMKTLSNKVSDIEVYYSNKGWRRYNIQYVDRLGDYHNIYQNQKPTLSELKELKEKITKRGFIC